MAARIYSLAPDDVLGSLCFGMARNEVWAILGPPRSAFRRSESSPSENGSYGRTTAGVIQGLDGPCEATEIAAPANVDLDGLLLVGGPFSDATLKHNALAPDVAVDETRAIAPSPGIGIYASSALGEHADP